MLRPDFTGRRRTPISGERRTVRVAAGSEACWPWLWALPAGAVLFAGFGAFSGGVFGTGRPGGVWSDIAGTLGRGEWRAFARVSAVVWGYYGLFAGAGFALGALELDNAMPSARRWSLGIIAVLAAPLGRAALEWFGARAFLGLAPPAADFVFLLLPAFGFAAMAMAFSAALPRALEPTALDFGGRFDRFGPEADQAHAAHFQGAVLLGGFFLVSLLGLLLVL